MLKILFIGDIVGRIGREAVAAILPSLKKKYKIDLVIANAENAAHGSGVTEDIAKELMAAGIGFMTTGDHAFRGEKKLELFDRLPILRPANFPPGVPGRGHAVFKAGRHNILLINLIGRVFMKMDYDCPFRKIDEILANADLPVDKLSAIIIDIHAEATSEKTAFRHYVDGRVSAVLGTHTHIMTADAGLSGLGTAYITDTGMAGAAGGCLGIDKENIIKTFLTQIKYPHAIPEVGEAEFNAVLVNIDEKTRKTQMIEPIKKFITMKIG